MLYANFFFIVMMLLLFSPIYLKFDDKISVRFFGFYIPIKKGQKKPSIKKIITTTKQIFSKWPLIKSMARHSKIVELRVKETLPFNPYSFTLSWSMVYMVKAYLREHFYVVKNDSFEIENGMIYKIDSYCIIELKLVDIIIVGFKNFAKNGGIYGSSHS